MTALLIFSPLLIFLFIMLCIFVGPRIFAYALSPLWERDRNAGVIRLVIALLEQEGWTSDHYRMSHPSGVSMWIANGWSSVSLTISGAHANPSNYNEGVYLNMYWKRRLWDAIQNNLSTVREAELERNMEKFAGNVINFAKAKEERS